MLALTYQRTIVHIAADFMRTIPSSNGREASGVHKKKAHKLNLLQPDLDHIFSHVEPFWGQLSEKSVFLTGGTGFFGKWLLESFAWNNAKLDLQAEICVLSRNPSLFIERFPHFTYNPNVKIYSGDVREFDFPEERFDYIIHAATDTDTHIHKVDPFSTYDTIVDGTRRVLKFARICEAKKILYVSSGAVYGVQPPEISHITEDYMGAPDTRSPKSIYGEAKRVSELLGSTFYDLYGLSFSIARCFAFVGPYLKLDLNYAVGNFIRDALAGGPIRVSGDGTTRRSYMYAADLAIWLWSLLLNGRSCEAYNVGSSDPVSIKDLAYKVSDLFPSKPDVLVAKSVQSKNPPERYIPSILKAKRELKLDCWIDLNTALKHTVQWHLR